MHGDGRQTRDFTYVGTVSTVLTRAVTARVACDGPVNLAFGGRYELMVVLDLLEGILGHPIARHHAPPHAGDVRDSQADCGRLLRLFPDIEPISLEDGLRRTVEWFRSIT